MNKVLMMALFLASVGSVNGATKGKGSVKKTVGKTGSAVMNKKNAVLKQLNSRRSKAIFGANGAGTYTGGDVSKTSATPPTASMPGANGSGTYTGGAASTATTAAASTAATAAAEPATTVAS